MTTHRRRTPALSATLAVVLGLGGVVLGASSSHALPRDVPLQADFTDLHAGSHAEKSWVVSVPYTAEISSVVVRTAGSGGVRWSAHLCPVGAGACTDLTTLHEGTVLAADSYRLRVGVTMDRLVLGDVATLEGRLRLRELSGVLAHTGGDPVPVVLAALAAAVVGVLLLLMGRRRRSDDDSRSAT